MSWYVIMYTLTEKTANNRPEIVAKEVKEVIQLVKQHMKMQNTNTRGQNKTWLIKIGIPVCIDVPSAVDGQSVEEQ